MLRYLNFLLGYEIEHFEELDIRDFSFRHQRGISLIFEFLTYDLQLTHHLVLLF